jgi:DNA (cytosine-5)-methyltransferase 1
MPKQKYKIIDLFAGIGGIRLGFEANGCESVFSSEWDKDAAITYEANFGEKPAGDITLIDTKDIPDFDILLAGFPCQPFSIIGRKQGFGHDTQGTLFFDIERIIRDKKPKAFLLENVRNLTAHDEGRTFMIIREHLEALGYTIHYKVLNARDFGVPHNRTRIIIVGFRDDITDFHFPEGTPLEEHKTLNDILEPENTIDKKYYVKDRIRESRQERMKVEIDRPYISHENMSGSVTPRKYSSALRSGASANYILINNERRPTEREMLRLQGFPDSFRIVLPYAAIKRQTGNSVCVPLMTAVAKEVVRCLDEKDPS